MTVKIKGNGLGFKKIFEVKGSVNNQDRADEMLIKLLELSVDNDKDVEQLSEKEQLKFSIENLKKERLFKKDAFLFLQKTLKLTDKQVEEAGENVDFSELGEFLSYVIGRIKGRTEEQIELDKQETEKDPKKE
ncbi:phage tail tube assembly chaperone [Liquorilactobacillus mali]|uniref:Uncharacterized protein n=1 Tax=Liquorilactobacillus mali KCTC 3596 = DSM 20444 TaxID=1046596 RepID=J1F410_9LACO|nr:phage tail tube assembly chaperone [Liquorilactobacillus mali]EJF00346.1 hypothetical protein LMA_03708 [Liquorilactobacillus mali KCTC 3596 = DSM 20444]KRN08830.1 hypothetical protein FD00_GL001747 [Liquorilactobacillus mali KCTC 3596 = DSM 20444]QFQ74580.1 hypothetical protein LM596_05375 [Liquorilactobacillus mali]